MLRLTRNVGEVTGVFGQYVVKPNPGFSGYPSSVNIYGLSLPDKYISSLNPPKFSDVFFPKPGDPPISPDVITRGKTLFKNTCQAGGCHSDPAPLGKVASVDPTPLLQDPKHNPLKLPDLNTDPNNTMLAALTKIDCGILAGTPPYVVGFGKIKQSDGASALLANLVIGTLLNQKGAVLAAYLKDDVFGSLTKNKQANTQSEFLKQLVAAVVTDKAREKADGVNASKKSSASNSADPTYTIGYESRSLNGIWASAPYLHNGSVPNLHALLWPQERKPFYAGSRVYDPELVGFVSDDPSQGVLFNPSIPGNSNQGHLYGANLSEDEKNALFAFLKSWF